MPAEKAPSVIQQVMANLTSEEMVTLFSVVALILFVLGHLIWAVETRHSGADFAKPYSQGISDGLWWGAVTMTTVGYGDFAPKTLCGRIIGFFWMLVGVAVSGLLIGLITDAFSGNSAYTVVDIKDMGEMKDVQICTIPGFTEDFAGRYGLTYEPILAASIHECWKDLLSTSQVMLCAFVQPPSSSLSQEPSAPSTLMLNPAIVADCYMALTLFSGNVSLVRTRPPRHQQGKEGRHRRLCLTGSGLSWT